MKPLAIDLFCGLGGWTGGLLAENFRVIGFDNEQHVYGDHRYPAQLVLQDVLTLHGRQFKDAALIVASPPCQAFSYMSMPWSRAKAMQRRIEADPEERKRLTALFDACFRIQREACEAAGRHIPIVVENVRGAQKWVGKARWNFGSYFLWGDVPALMPIPSRRKTAVGSWDTTRANYNPDHSWQNEAEKLPGNNSERRWEDRPVQRLCDATKNTGGSWFNIGSPGQKETGKNPVHELSKDGRKFGSSPGKVWADRPPSVAAHREASLSEQAERGVKAPNGEPLGKNTLGRKHGSKSNARKAASAMIAKIPFTLAQWIARCWKPR